ncbi:unnamed protein product [Urochloa humidicola]
MQRRAHLFRLQQKSSELNHSVSVRAASNCLVNLHASRIAFYSTRSKKFNHQSTWRGRRTKSSRLTSCRQRRTEPVRPSPWEERRKAASSSSRHRTRHLTLPVQDTMDRILLHPPPFTGSEREWKNTSPDLDGGGGGEVAQARRGEGIKERRVRRGRPPPAAGHAPTDPSTAVAARLTGRPREGVARRRKERLQREQVVRHSQ